MSVNAPLRPLGVYIVQPNGDTVPVELSYAGVQDSVHVWECMTPIPLGGLLRVAMLPAHTSIQFPAPTED